MGLTWLAWTDLNLLTCWSYLKSEKKKVKVSLLTLYLYRVCSSLKDKPSCIARVYLFYWSESLVRGVCLLGGGLQRVGGVLKGSEPVLWVLCVAAGRMKACAALWASCF